MRILFVSQYGVLAASSRTRVFQYLPYLAEQGIDSAVITVLPDRAIAGSQIEVTRNILRKIAYYIWAFWRTTTCGLRAWWRAGDVDVLFVQKVIFPAPVRWLLRWRRPPLVFDFDDAIFTTEVRHKNWLAAWKERRNSSGLPAMLRLADRAVVENEYTAAFAAPYCQVITITGPIDTDRYPTRSDGDRDPAAGVVVGWIGSGTSAQYLDLIREPLTRLGGRYPDLTFRVVGARDWTTDGIRVESKAWALEEEEGDLRGFDIGIMPIADDRWTRGKGGYKLLQYMSCGLPVVTSPVGINRRLVEDGSNGFLADDPEEWEERLAQLIEQPDLRREMGRRGRACVETTYALAVQRERLLDMFRDLVRSCP